MALPDNQLRQIIEAALMAVDEPMSLDRLGGIFLDHERPSPRRLRETLADIESSCQGRGFQLLQTASGWRFVTAPEVADFVGRLWQEPPSKYSRALVETLALIAYRQPVTRGDIESIRGVSVSSGIMRTLEERSWVRVVGHKEVPGRPALYATTRQFLDHFGLQSLDQLPPIDAIEDGLPDLLSGAMEPNEGTNS